MKVKICRTSAGLIRSMFVKDCSYQFLTSGVFLTESYLWQTLQVRTKCNQITSAFCNYCSIKVNEPRYKRCGVTPHFPGTKKQLPKILLRRGVRQRMTAAVGATVLAKVFQTGCSFAVKQHPAGKVQFLFFKNSLLVLTKF